MSDPNACKHEKVDWMFHNPVRLIFGIDYLSNLPELVREKRVLFVTTPGFTRRGITERVRRLVGPSLVYVMDTVRSNPELDDLERAAQVLHKVSAEVIVAVGGGSVIDTAKVISAILTVERQPFSLRSHLKNSGGELASSGIPIIAVPTTAGTGSEVTPFATVWDSVTRRKYSLTGANLFPQVALLDPQMTVSLPRTQTIMCGLDAISHAFESLWNRNATPITTMYATEALEIAIPTLELLATDLGNIYYRAEMLRASTLAGLAISNSRTALAHSMSYPLTMYYGVPHGLACSFTLPAILQFNSEVDDGRLYELALSLKFHSVDEMYEHVKQLFDVLGVKSMLAQYVRSVNQLEDLVQQMLTPGRADNNLRLAGYDDLVEILKESNA